MKRNYSILCLIFLGLTLHAQVATHIILPEDINKYSSLFSLENIKFFTAPKFDLTGVEKEDSTDQVNGKPPRFGKSAEFTLGIKDGTWQYDFKRGGRIWTLGITSSKAKAISLLFRKLSIPNGGELFIYNSDKTVVFGPVTKQETIKSERFISDLVNGDKIILELFEPIGAKDKSEIEVERLLHAYKLFVNDNPGTILNCHRDIACPEGNNFLDEARAVALVFDAVAGRWCSGALLNNACQNGRPTFMSARHCLDMNGDGVVTAGERANPSNWVFRFNYKSPSCNGGDSPYWLSILGGAVLRAEAVNSDAILVEFQNRPQSGSGITYLGWSRNINVTSAACISHPQGNVMKIAIDNQPPIIENSPLLATPNAVWRTTWDNGTVQQGSSGGPYLDQNRRVFASVHGGAAIPTCDDRFSWGGRFDMSWEGGFNAFLSDDPSVMTTNTIGIPSFNIPNELCNNVPINLTNMPPNMSVFGGSLVGANLTGWFSGIEPQQGFNGLGHFELQFKPNGIICNDPLIIRSNFWVGPPLAPQVSFMPGVECYGWLSVDNANPTHNYNWTITRGGNTYYVSGPAAYLNHLGPNYASVSYSVTASNTCGSVTVTGNETLTNCDGPFFNSPNSSSLVMTAKTKTYNWTMQLSPNPVSNDLNIALSAYDERLMHTMGEMHVVNMMGQTVYKAQQVLDNNMRLNTQNLNNGFYILEIKGAGFSTRQRFNVSR